MSNEIATLLKSIPTLVGGTLDEDTLAVAGAGGSNKRISIKGSVFRKMAGGKEVGTIEERHMNIIFVKMAHSPSRTYYEGVYKEGSKVSPVCWSNDSKVPDAEVKAPKAAKCDECPMSVKGSGNGGSGTACRLSWRTAVVLPQDPGGDVMQLVLPATSVFGKEDGGKWPFRAYIQMLAGHNISAGRVITKMQFDTSSPVPKVFFSPFGAVPDEAIDDVQQQAKSTHADNAVKLTVFQQDEKDDGEKFEQMAAPEGDKEEDHKEPVVREVAKPDPQPVNDVSSIVQKWTKKKG